MFKFFFGTNKQCFTYEKKEKKLSNLIKQTLKKTFSLFQKLYTRKNVKLLKK